ncbi:BT4734/BF3469 family protein [Sphingobacterium lactis]|uniref:BT4734/BF3469 family protein n=1 Tax=Sphingobacterium lactis TaxID=797291 RepID=UPI003EC7798D
MIDPLEFTVFYQDGVYGFNRRETTVRAILTDIVKGKYRTNVAYLRDLLSKGDKEGYSREKINLPAVTFGATFHDHRTTKDLKTYTSLLVLDIDDLGTEKEVIRVENFLRKDKYVISCWRSPSNLGLKGIVYLEYKESFPLEQTAYFHQSAFGEVAKYFKSTYGIDMDESGKDVVRTCFVSHDSRLYYNKKFENFEVSLSPTIKIKSTKKRVLSSADRTVTADVLYNPKGKNTSLDRKEIRQVIKFLRKNELSITRIHSDWSNVARTIACCFTFDIGLKYFQALSMQDATMYEAEECERFLKERYFDTRAEFSLATILYLANEKGYNNRGVDKNRRKIKDIIMYLDKKKLSIISLKGEREEVGKSIVQIFKYEIGIKYFKMLHHQEAGKYDEQECESFLKELYLINHEGYSFENILKLANIQGYKERDGVLKMASELSVEQVVSINSVFESNNV